MLNFLHTADWHPKSDGTICGKPATDPKTGLSKTLTDFQESLAWIEALIVEHEIQLLLIPGDIFDSSHPSMDEIRVVMNFIASVSGHCTIVMIPGNHDLAQSGVLASAIEPIRHIEGVHLATRPSTFHLDSLGPRVRVDCLPYPTRGRLLATEESQAIRTPDELNHHINRLLQAIIAGFIIQHVTEEIHILLAHGSVRNATIGEQPRSIANDIFIPLPENNPYNYTALGHIHQTQQPAPNCFYSGSLLRQSFGEENERKGVIIGRIDSQAKFPGLEVEFIENPHARVYKTVGVEEMATLAMDSVTAYRIKGTVDPLAMPLIQAQVETLQGQKGNLQVSIDIVNPDRMRDQNISGSMDSTQALIQTMIHQDLSEVSQRKLLECHEVILAGVIA